MSRPAPATVEEAPRPLIPSKLAAPVPRQRVSRRALLDVCVGGHRKLTLIRAPAGWGKSTLLADWHANEARSFAWVSLEADDNDPVRFWTYFVSALRSVDPSVGEMSLLLLRTPRISVIDDVLPALCKELTAPPGPIVLVLDDYHLIANPEIDEAVSFFIEHLPRALEVVVSSRSVPALPLARLRARGDLVEIDAEQLRFTEDETDLLLNELHGLDLDRDDVIRLRELTEGWAAGLYLATLSLRGRAGAHELIGSFSGDNRHVVDYLSAEVLAGLPAAMRRFLLDTSVLTRLCAPLCDAVTDGSGSVNTLHELEGSNFFLIPLDTRREWYRYHHLFAELLHRELVFDGPDHARSLHRRASAWHRQFGTPSEAVHHATAAGDASDAAELILGYWIEARDSARLETLLAWLDGLPAGTVAADARLCLVKATTLQEVGRIAEADDYLEVAAIAAADASLMAGPSSVLSGVAAAKAINCYFHGDETGIGKAARPALDEEEPGSDYWRSALLTAFGVATFLSGDSHTAAEVLDHAVRSSRQSGHSLALIHALGWCAVVHVAIGEPDRARVYLDHTEALLERTGLTAYYGMSMAHVARGKLLESHGRLRAADDALTTGIALARRSDAKFELAYGLLIHAEVKDRLGERLSARELILEARAAVDACADPGILPELVADVERRHRLTSHRTIRTPHDDDLSERELAVLRLLATDLTQREIGDTLYVSFNTVKSHVKSIFRKLDVTTRPDAVSRARELRLL